MHGSPVSRVVIAEPTSVPSSAQSAWPYRSPLTRLLGCNPLLGCSGNRRAWRPFQKLVEARVDIDIGSLVIAFVVAGIGFVLFSYGRSMKRAPHIGVGLTLMVFPYFVSGPW